MAVGGLESPIYIEKHLVAEWTARGACAGRGGRLAAGEV